MSAKDNPVTELAAYLETITQIYEATAAAGFLRSVEQFDLKEINVYLEKGRSSEKRLAERFDQLEEASRFDVLLLSADLNSLAVGTLRKLCKARRLEQQGAKAALIERLSGSILEKAENLTEFPANLTGALLAEAASDEARSAAARAISIGVSGFGLLMGKTALQQVLRLTWSLHFAAGKGGIESYLSATRTDTVGTLIDLSRRISAHEEKQPVPEDLLTIIQKSTAGNLKSVLRRKGLPFTGNKATLVRGLVDSLEGTAPGRPAARETNSKPTGEPSDVERQAREAEEQYLALLRKVRTASLAKIKNDFAALKSRPSSVILALGKLRGYSESSASRLLARLWSNIELAAATAQRSDLRK